MSVQSITEDLYRSSLSHQEDTIDVLLEALQTQFSMSSAPRPNNALSTYLSAKPTKSRRLFKHIKKLEDAACSAKSRETRSLGLHSLSKARAERLREQTLSMIYTNISPWPDSVWTDIMAEHALRCGLALA